MGLTKEQRDALMEYLECCDADDSLDDIVADVMDECIPIEDGDDDLENGLRHRQACEIVRKWKREAMAELELAYD